MAAHQISWGCPNLGGALLRKSCGSARAVHDQHNGAFFELRIGGKALRTPDGADGFEAAM